MESLQSLNQRKKSVKNIGAITKAMEVVAAIKMRKSQEVTLISRPYAFKVLNLLEKLSHFTGAENIYAKRGEVKNSLILVMTSDRGLIGSFNTQVFRAVENFLRQKEGNHSFVAVGKKAESYLTKRGFNVVKSFTGFGDIINFIEIEELLAFVIDGFENGRWDSVSAISMHFRSALKQETLMRDILPLDVENIRKTVSEIVPEHGLFSEEESGPEQKRDEKIDYIFEPSREVLLKNLLPHLLKMELYHLIMEANSSEHAARYVAMKGASDNAKELSEDLIIQYNKARQAAITGELVEMSATQSALN